MKKNKELVIDKIDEWDGYNPTEVYRTLKKPDVSVFSTEERKMLNRIIKK